MPTYYVSSKFPAGFDGSSWTSAYNSIYSGVNASAGSIIKIDNQHDEQLTSNVNFPNGTRSSPILLISCNSGIDTPEYGAILRNNVANREFYGSIYAYGLIIEASGTARFGGSTNTPIQTYNNCLIYNKSNASHYFGFNMAKSIVKNCTINALGHIGGNFHTIFCGYTTVLGSTLINRANGTLDTIVSANASTDQCTHLFMAGCEMINNVDVSLFNGNYGKNIFLFGCSLPNIVGVSGAPVYITSPTVYCNNLNISCCEPWFISGTPIGLNANIYRGTYGQTTTETAIWRTNGANDGQRQYCYKMVSTSDANENGKYGLNSPSIIKLVSPGSGIVTLYIAGSVTLQNDELSVVLLSPNESGSADRTARYAYRSSEIIPLATPVDLLSDDSVWEGSYGGVEQKVVFTITPQVAGPVIATVNLYRPNTTIYLDPVIHFSGLTS